MSEFMNFDFSPLVKRFIDENPWHGGPPQSSSTSPLCGSCWYPLIVFIPALTFLRITLQSSVKTVQSGLFFLYAFAAGWLTSMAQHGLAMPAWWSPSESPPHPENTSSVRRGWGTAGSAPSSSEKVAEPELWDQYSFFCSRSCCYILMCNLEWFIIVYHDKSEPSLYVWLSFECANTLSNQDRTS